MSSVLEDLGHVESLLANVTQASILVPMVVVWARRRYFPGPVRLLSWYVYLSLFSVIGARFFHIGNPPSNMQYLIGFNVGKIALFGAVYYQVLTQRSTRRLVAGITGAVLAGMLITVLYDMRLAVSVSRVAHCTVLAAFALLYFDQYSERARGISPMKDPLWLVSMGQLLYSAVTISFFSYDFITEDTNESVWRYLFMDVGGLAFNFFLTLAFLRAQPSESGVSASETPSVNMLLRH